MRSEKYTDVARNWERPDLQSGCNPAVSVIGPTEGRALPDWISFEEAWLLSAVEIF